MPSPLDSLINPGARQLPSPWASIPATPTGYIAGANGENVINDYREGGKYSTYSDARRGVIQTPDLQTLSSGGENHAQAWAKGNTSPQKIQGPFQGMPQNLATIAQKNLSIADKQINAFNEKAKLFSFGSAHNDVTSSVSVPARQTGLVGSALDRKAYDQAPNANLVSAGAPKIAVGVEDQRRTTEEEAE